MSLPEHVSIREVLLRDGLQLETPIALADKLKLLEAVAATGVREVEATAFVSPTKMPALADAAELAAQLHHYPDIEFSALVASPNGAKRALAAGFTSLEYVVSAADGHSRANVGISSAEAIARIQEIVTLARGADATVEVIVACSAGLPLRRSDRPEEGSGHHAEGSGLGCGSLRAGRYHRHRHPASCGESDCGCKVDHRRRTAGRTFPQHPWVRLGQRVCRRAIRSNAPRLVDWGLGGCPFAPGATGNIATEDLAYLLRDSDVNVDINLDAAIAAAQIVQEVVGHEVPSALLRAGDRLLN